MSHIEVNILHQDYILSCPDGQEIQLREAAERVDSQFQKIRNSSKLRSRERVGVLLAVNLAYENLELRNQLQALQAQIATLQAESVESLMDADGWNAQQEAQLQLTQATQVADTLAARIDAALLPASAFATDCTAEPDQTFETDIDVIELQTAELQPQDDTLVESLHGEIQIAMPNTLTLDTDNLYVQTQAVDEAL